ncbi:NUDIX hydrolase [Bifidobacterium criceti]|uniref:Pyrophosphate-releasing NTPase in MutT family n=1 Tax=Bifidobacterium criceti TaxID=1960969 RepID=A0A2A2EEE6_9BIFI|nr:NUDIX hydrolase [Bifidobacterium criceti]PAU67305.1 pyrophosphate-releasing NTPase in MutT family [Bifidobacterium criceti]
MDAEHAQSTRAQLDIRFDGTSDGIDMDVPARIVDVETTYRGAIFDVEDRTIALTRNDGGETLIRRQVIVHAPCVVMLVHDTRTDRYLVEREYRAGANIYTIGLPAGLIDDGEDPREASLRELREETGVIPDGDITFDTAGDYYSSEGMTDELAHIAVLHLDGWRQGECRFDADEHVESAWVDWDTLMSLPITASNSIIAIQHERMRRLERERGCARA